MTETLPWRDRYLQLIDQIVQTTLKGKIRSKEQVYQMLVQDISPGTGEIFERCLGDQLSATQRQVETQTDEFKLAKTNRILRALQTIQGEWQRWQENNQATEAVTTVIQQIVRVEPAGRLIAFLRAIDPNQPQAFGSAQLKQMAKTLLQQADQSADPDIQQDLKQLAEGIVQGLESRNRLQDYLVSWIYDQSQGQLGFEGVLGQRGPWAVWAKQSVSPLPQALFQTLALENSVTELISRYSGLSLSSWVELEIVLQYVQQGLVSWFDKLVYDSKVGSKLSISVFLAFAVTWSQLANGFSQSATLTPLQKARFAEGAFQVTIQILRMFAQREYFPLYGGIFASFSPNQARDALIYLDEPLRRVEGTQEKARILTLLAYSLRVQGQYSQANGLHQEVLEIARQGGDRACEIANLNHLSRNCAAQKNYTEAVNYSQRALILSRQVGDRLGEANALTNLGYSEVLQAQQLEQADPESYDTAINYLQQGLRLSERLGDRQSQALCLSSLGIAHIVLDQPQAAMTYLEGAMQAAQFSGDLYLQGSNLAYLAEAHYRLQELDKAVCAGSLGMYLLEQISAREWRQPAGLLSILQGQMGDSAFQSALQQHRSQIVAAIGIDGYEHLPQLLEKYRHSTG